MAKKNAVSETTAAATVGPATQADLDLAAGLPSSPRKQRGWIVSGTLVDTLANPKMQASLRSVSKELGVLGIDVEGLVDTANQAATLNGALGRLDESTGRVHQQAVELNRELLNGQTALLAVQESATTGTTLKKALRGLAIVRQQQVAQTKRIKTVKKKAKKKP